MHITTVSRFKLVAAMTRGFFQGFVNGQIDAKNIDINDLKPVEYKQIIADNYETLSASFVSVMFPILIRLNYDNLNEVSEDMKKRKFSNFTSPKILLRYACGSKPIYDAVTKEYQTQMTALLNGVLQPMKAFFETYEKGAGEVDTVEIPLAIRSLVRTQMMSYSASIQAANTEIKALHQATVFKLMLQGMVSLLHDESVALEGNNLEMIFRRVSLNSDNFETLMNEMNQAYEDLV